MQAPRLLLNVARRQVGRRTHYVDHSYPLTTFNDLPCPQGSWKTHYDANQRRYNAHLVAGVAVLAGTVLFGTAAGFLDGHDDIPERPADIASYK